MSTHVNYDNIRDLLYSVAQNLKDKINAIDLTQTQKDMLIKIDKIIKTGTGTSFLSDNGTYKNIPLDKIQTMVDNLGVIYNIFKISQVSEYWDNTGISNIPSALEQMGCVQWNGKIYCIGGYNGNIYNTLYIYDIASNIWTTGTPMPIAKRGFVCETYNGKIYCAGGHNGSQLTSLYIYDILSNTWTIGNSMPISQFGSASSLYNGKIYSIAGYNDGYINKMQIYDILSNSWSYGPNYPLTIAWAKSVLYNNKIYCVGGTDGNIAISDTYIYDIIGNVWSSGINIPEGRIYPGVIIYNDQVWCIGGNYNNAAVGSIYIYDLTKSTWRLLSTKMLIPRGPYASVQYKGRVYCIAGWIGGSVQYTNTIDLLYLPYISYTVQIPQNILDKLSLIVTNGTGSKLLTDKGVYQEYIPSGYREMSSDELNNLVTGIKSIMT